MTRTSSVKNQYKDEIKQANLKIKPHKYNFSPEFAEKLYKFSEEHHEEHFKIFNASFEEWFKAEAETELRKLKGTGTAAEIKHKIKISARFYYRKKTKKESKKEEEEPKQKPQYIGLSQEFINRMDEYIKDLLIQTQSAIHQKTCFTEFTQQNIAHIKDELILLKQKYDEHEIPYVPREISMKFKKAFSNRYYTYVEYQYE